MNTAQVYTGTHESYPLNDAKHFFHEMEKVLVSAGLDIKAQRKFTDVSKILKNNPGVSYDFGKNPIRTEDQMDSTTLDETVAVGILLSAWPVESEVK